MARRRKGNDAAGVLFIVLLIAAVILACFAPAIFLHALFQRSYKKIPNEIPGKPWALLWSVCACGALYVGGGVVLYEVFGAQNQYQFFELRTWSPVIGLASFVSLPASIAYFIQLGKLRTRNPQLWSATALSHNIHAVVPQVRVSPATLLNTSTASQTTTTPAPKKSRPEKSNAKANVPRSTDEIARTIKKSLNGLVGMETLTTQLASDLFEFLSSSDSRGRVFWGAPGTGKSEVAQRLAGLRRGIPGIEFSDTEIQYVAGVDGKIEIKEIVESIEERGVVFIDEADKCLDPAAGMVTASEAKQLQYALVTHFSRKPIYWVLMGSFSAMRAEGPITYDALSNTLGKELASRLDFADWQFPSWTIESLLKAVSKASEKRKLRYDDEALLAIVQYCLSTGGGVRTFELFDQALARRMQSSAGKVSENSTVTLSIAQEALARFGHKAA